MKFLIRNSKFLIPSVKPQRGFTLTELLVSVSIFAIITAVFLIRSGNFGEQLLVENLAYDVALSIRRAQAYSIQVRETEAFVGRHGIYFDTNTATSYVLFTDFNPENEQYDGGTELLEEFSITGGNAIDDICYLDSFGSENCNHSTADIVFIRPNPDAFIEVDDTDRSSVRVYLISPRGERWAVTVYTTGQITVEPPPDQLAN